MAPLTRIQARALTLGIAFPLSTKTTMPRRGASEFVKYQVLSVVLQHDASSARLKARMRAVSKGIRAIVPKVVPPMCAVIIGDIADNMARFPSFTAATCDDNGDMELVVDRRYDIDDGIIVRIRKKNTYYLVSRCKIDNFKFIMYRAIEKNRRIGNIGGLGDILNSLKVDTLVVMY